MTWGREVCHALRHVDPASALSPASIWRHRGSPMIPGLIEELRTGRGQKWSRSKQSRGTVVGRRRWVRRVWQPGQQSQTNFQTFYFLLFLNFLFIILKILRKNKIVSRPWCQYLWFESHVGQFILFAAFVIFQIFQIFLK